jgi:5-methyltetrahydrofolate--homocysteine methyltransferase
MGNFDYDELIKSVYEGDVEKTIGIIQLALQQGISATSILDDGLIRGMDKVGVEFKCGDLFLPEVLLAARAMKAGVTVIQPLLLESGSKIIGTVALGTVEGDVHDIGKNLVGMMLEGAGFKVIDLGTNVSCQKFIKTIKNEKCQILGMSAMLTTTMMSMKLTIDAMKEDGCFNNVKVMVGGAPVTREFADKMGAFYSPNAAEAVDLAKEIIS